MKLTFIAALLVARCHRQEAWLEARRRARAHRGHMNRVASFCLGHDLCRPKPGGCKFF